MWLNFFLELSKIYKKKLIFLFLIMILTIIFDVISIGSIFPLLSFFVTENKDYLEIFNLLEYENLLFDEKNIYLYAITIVFILFLFKNLFYYFY